MEGDTVIVATGGFSYQSTGSTGDGYRFARELGLKVTEIAPSLVPLKTKEDYIPKLQGLSLKNTGLTIKNGKKVLYEDFGEMMFTHFGSHRSNDPLRQCPHRCKNWQKHQTANCPHIWI